VISQTQIGLDEVMLVSSFWRERGGRRESREPELIPSFVLYVVACVSLDPTYRFVSLFPIFPTSFHNLSLTIDSPTHFKNRLRSPNLLGTIPPSFPPRQNHPRSPPFHSAFPNILHRLLALPTRAGDS